MKTESLLSLSFALIKATSQVIKGHTGNRASLGEKLGSINISGDKQVALDKIMDDFIMDWLTQNANLPLLVMSEETGVRQLGSNPNFFMIIDPVDGSNNLRPWFTPAPVLGISVGIGCLDKLRSFKDERALLLTVNKEIFGGHYYYAIEGQGAYFCFDDCSCRITSSPKQDLLHPVIGVDLDLASSIPAPLNDILSSGIIVRRLGSSILDFCNVACGQYDAYVSLGRRLKVTDIAQSAFLVRSAGGVFDRRLYIDGKEDKKLSSSYLYDAFFEDVSLLNRIKFSVVCAGNQSLYEKIMWKYKIS